MFSISVISDFKYVILCLFVLCFCSSVGGSGGIGRGFGLHTLCRNMYIYQSVQLWIWCALTYIYIYIHIYIYIFVCLLLLLLLMLILPLLLHRECRRKEVFMPTPKMNTYLLSLLHRVDKGRRRVQNHAGSPEKHAQEGINSNGNIINIPSKHQHQI